MDIQDIVIRTSALGKSYRLYDNPIDRLKEVVSPIRKSYSRPFAALENVNIEIRRGQTIGIIGRNGSGKSTLLKILAGVLSPSSGSFEVHGKVAALLELGAGFNPEMTGVENLYLSGSMMGISREEMAKKIDGILEFAAIGNYAYQPVKSYSSGMYARLAFASAINVSPDILIVDEALSVGDSYFQHKCFQKIKQLKENGVTILLVTHSYQQVLDNADMVMHLEQGMVRRFSGDVRDVVYAYEAENRNSGSLGNNLIEADTVGSVIAYSFGTKEAKIEDLIITTAKGESKDLYESGDAISFEFVISAERDFSDIVLGVNLRTAQDVTVWGDNNIQAKTRIALKKGRNIIRYSFSLFTRPGDYFIYCGIADISGEQRVELDQRWPIKKISVISTREMSNGYLWSPVTIYVHNGEDL